MAITFLTDEDEKNFVKTVNGQTPDKNGNVEIEVGSDSGQNVTLTTEQINALHGMFRVCLFDDSKDVDGAISAFETAFGITGGGETPDEPDAPVVTTYSVEYELVNVSSNNSVASVTEGASYSATLTAADGYTMEGAAVTVTMGGVDVTADVYADGVISITSVTDNVEIMASALQIEQEIEAVLPEDGLAAYFDLRNAPATTTEHTTAYSIDATKGEGMLYAWYASSAGNDYGMPLVNSTYSRSTDANDATALGAAFTASILSYDDISSLTFVDGYSSFSNAELAKVCGKYNKADGTGSTGQTGSTVPRTTGYHIFTLVVDHSACRVYHDGLLQQAYDGNDYDGFVSWYSVILTKRHANSTRTTALALYERALSDVELVELEQYLKTLEVSA